VTRRPRSIASLLALALALEAEGHAVGDPDRDPVMEAITTAADPTLDGGPILPHAATYVRIDRDRALAQIGIECDRADPTMWTARGRDLAVPVDVDNATCRALWLGAALLAVEARPDDRDTARLDCLLVDNGAERRARCMRPGRHPRFDLVVQDFRILAARHGESLARAAADGLAEWPRLTWPPPPIE
jgi:hypothetical protein